MRRRARANLALFALAALLGLGVCLELARERRVEPLTALDPAAVRTLEVDCLGGARRRFEKAGGHWRMLEPYAAPADDAAVDRLAAIAAAPVRARLGAVPDRARLGLDPPQATLTLDGTVLKFGQTDAIDGDRYAEAGGVVSRVPDRFSVLLFAGPENELARPPTAGP